MMDLQEAYQTDLGLLPGGSVEMSRTTTSSSLNFTSALGSLAAHIDEVSVETINLKRDEESRVAV